MANEAVFGEIGSFSIVIKVYCVIPLNTVNVYIQNIPFYPKKRYKKAVT